jgi:hypothetical protein
MNGNRVIVKVFGGDFAVRRVWSVGQSVVYVTDDKNYDLLKESLGGVSPVGIPKEDVFEYSEEIRSSRVNEAGLKRWRN